MVQEIASVKQDPSLFILRGKEIVFPVVFGTILDIERDKETSVHSSGGGGSIYNGTGYISSPTIYSTTTTIQGIWYRDNNGYENRIQITDKDIPIRKDHQVCFVYGAVSGQRHNYLLCIYNFTTGEMHFTMSPKDFLDENELLKMKSWSFKKRASKPRLKMRNILLFLPSVVFGIVFGKWIVNPKNAFKKAALVHSSLSRHCQDNSSQS